MTEYKRTVYVTSDQVDAAQSLIRLRGGEDKVSELIRRVAHAEEPDRTVRSDEPSEAEPRP